MSFFSDWLMSLSFRRGCRHSARCVENETGLCLASRGNEEKTKIKRLSDQNSPGIHSFNSDTAEEKEPNGKDCVRRGLWAGDIF